MSRFDCIIVGQGLAGTALAWALRWRGFRVMVIDRHEANTASRIAAGLLTPFTGLRIVQPPGWNHDFPLACDFYRRAEHDTTATFLTHHHAVRLFASESERTNFQNRGKFSTADCAINPEWFIAPHGGFEMYPAAQLDVPGYLDASRRRFALDGDYREATIDPTNDISLEPGAVALPRLGVRATELVFCEGIAGRENPFFEKVRFTPAKGEILTIRVPKMEEKRPIHRGLWLFSRNDGLYRVGATYDRENLTPIATTAGRDEITARLLLFLRPSFEIVEHVAAVRPVLDGGSPMLIRHSEFPQLYFFNGLGSKGALLAPDFATRFADNRANGIV